MKGKGLLTLGVLGMLSGAPNAHAGVDAITTGTNEALTEAISNPSPSTQNGKEILDFEYEKKLQEEQLMDSILNDEGVQELFQEYGQENVKHVIENMNKDKDTQKVIKRAFKDKEIKKALEENDKEALAKRVSEILNDFNNTNTRLLSSNIVLLLRVFAFIKDQKTINTLLKREGE